MANKVLKDVSLRLEYDFGMLGDKKITKIKTLSNINHSVSEDDLYNFAQSLFSIQTHSGMISKVEVSNITN